MTNFAFDIVFIIKRFYNFTNAMTNMFRVNANIVQVLNISFIFFLVLIQTVSHKLLWRLILCAFNNSCPVYYFGMSNNVCPFYEI